MKGLLHSKRFKNNLKKWLFMYVGVMGLLTTVITYSKYMSKFEGSSVASVAIFNVDINYSDCESTDIKEDGINVCQSAIKRSTSVIDYYFTVDTTGLEVNTLLALTIYVNKDFNIKELTISDINEDGSLGKEESIVVNKPSTVNESDKLAGYLLNTYSSKINAGEGKNKKYKLSIEYAGKCTVNGNECDKREIDYTSVKDMYNLVKINYSATQIKE